MKISYAITVCNEYDEIQRLIPLLLENKRKQDEIVVLFDQKNGDEKVRNVLEKFEKRIVVNDREFCGNFSKHRNYHITKCTGEYIFVLDADEIPQEALLKNIKSFDGEF